MEYIETKDGKDPQNKEPEIIRHQIDKMRRLMLINLFALEFFDLIGLFDEKNKK